MTSLFTTRDYLAPVHTMIGDSLAMRRLRATIEAVAPTRLSVLIQGPTGAGKELVAAALHALSGRRGAFVPFNVCAISDSMFEDAMFGHVRGAFTGAVSDAFGFLREADGGTVFLDEVSGLPVGAQVKLLRAIDTGIFRPVGARADRRSEFRVVSATNECIDDMVDAGRFRTDLLHRLGAVVVHVPALRERPEDIPPLARHFLETVGKGHVHIASQAMDALTGHDWPGNVRELRHVMEWSAAFSGPELTRDAVRAALSQRRSREARVDDGAHERAAIRDVLDRHRGNADRAAEELGVHRATLYRRMKRLGVEVREPN
ncbi:MAG TPA: sigma-54 dependent transcriptional regulator [Gemmatimonadaceae bacterium]|nr:sigma-54 dependent transcriptional regulator [Gemmatimonadaceae bacterium]